MPMAVLARSAALWWAISYRGERMKSFLSKCLSEGSVWGPAEVFQWFSGCAQVDCIMVSCNKLMISVLRVAGRLITIRRLGPLESARGVIGRARSVPVQCSEAAPII